MLEVRLRTRCFPTENRDKVISAISKLFPDAVFVGDDPIIGTSSSVIEFGEQLRQQRIRDAARAVMLRGAAGNTTIFRLNKQVASVGKINFSDEEHALGDIEVTIVADDLESVIESIAPDTRKERGL